MQNSNDIKEILIELRDAQREHLEEYKKVTRRSLQLQERAVERQEQLAKTYRIALIVSALLIIGIVCLIFYILSSMPTRYW